MKLQYLPSDVLAHIASFDNGAAAVPLRNIGRLGFAEMGVTFRSFDRDMVAGNPTVALPIDHGRIAMAFWNHVATTHATVDRWRGRRLRCSITDLENAYRMYFDEVNKSYHGANMFLEDTFDRVQVGCVCEAHGAVRACFSMGNALFENHLDGIANGIMIGSSGPDVFEFMADETTLMVVVKQAQMSFYHARHGLAIQGEYKRHQFNFSCGEKYGEQDFRVFHPNFYVTRFGVGMTICRTLHHMRHGALEEHFADVNHPIDAIDLTYSDDDESDLEWEQGQV